MNDTIPIFNMLDKTGGSFKVAGLLGREFSLEPKAFKKMAEQIKLANLANQNLGLEYQNSEKDIIENYRGRWEPKDYE